MATTIRYICQIDPIKSEVTHEKRNENSVNI